MFRKSLIFSLLTVCFLLNGLAEAAEVVGSSDARVYLSRLDKYSTIRVYNVAGEDYVPYVSAKDYLKFLYGEDISFNLSDDGDVFTATRNNIGVQFDIANLRLTCDNWDTFFGSYGDRALPNGILPPSSFNVLAVSEKNPSTETEQMTFAINLPAYGLQMVAYNGEVLLPFAALQNIFAVQQRVNVLSFNGDNFYDVLTPVDYIYGNIHSQNKNRNPYANEYYSGKFSELEEIPAVYARYAYGTTCLLFDLYYGHKEEKGIESFDSYLEANGLKEGLLSTDPEKNSEAFLDLVYRLFDSGHDDVMLSYGVFNTAKKFSNLNKTAETEQNEERYRSEEYGQLLDKFNHMAKLKPKNFGNSRVQIIDDTAFIYFEEFAESGNESNFYFKLPDADIYNASTFGLFYDAFAMIQRNSNVKKVVIDLSNNAGGDASALTAALGFISPDGEVNLTYYHTLNENFCSEWYHVDTNLDGVFDERDGFGGKYNFYILTSGCSYSCANALPFYAQMNGWAKIIGEQPGGGDCVVSNFLDAYGHAAGMSSWIQLGKLADGQFISDEHAVNVDIPFEKADKMYFNYSAIAKLLKNH